jgi:hypothetical protein
VRWLNRDRESRGAGHRAPHRRRPALESLEGRLALSATAPANTLGSALGDVTTHRGTEVAATITADHLTPGRPSTLIGLYVQPEGGGLEPRIVAVDGPDGRPRPLSGQAPALIGPPGSVVAFVQDAQPGTLTVRVSGAHGTEGMFQLNTFLPGDVNGDGHVTLADLQAFARSFTAKAGVRNYNPAADANLSGFIGISDARALQRNLPPLAPSHVPIYLELNVLPGEDVRHPGTYNSGAVVNQTSVTIRGRTVPGSLVFLDNQYGTYKFNGALLPTDAQGNFTDTAMIGRRTSTRANRNLNSNSHNFTGSVDFLVISPSGQQLIRNYPIRVL